MLRDYVLTLPPTFTQVFITDVLTCPSLYAPLTPRANDCFYGQYTSATHSAAHANTHF